MDVSPLGDIAFGCRETKVWVGSVRYSVPSMGMSQTIACKYLLRCVATSAAMSASERAAAAKTTVAGSGLVFSTRDTVGTWPSQSLAMSKRSREGSSDDSEETSECASVEGRN
jgi:hypothetical protein